MKVGYQVPKKEYVAYCLFFLGQNILWGYAGYIETFLTDIGFSAAIAGSLLIAPKVWDAVNDMLFGYLMDRHVFKNGQKFLPWIRIGVSAIGITTVVLFAIPASLDSKIAKIVWFMLAYIVFDVAYTILDAPAYALTTLMTTNVDERSGIIAGGKLWAMVGAVIATITISKVRPIFGWFGGCIVFCIVSVILMLPLLFWGKERVAVSASGSKDNETVKDNPSFKEMFAYLKGNKYLIVALVVFLLLGFTSIEQKMAIYIARICFGGEGNAIYIAASASFAVIVVSALVPYLYRKWDKLYVLCGGLIFGILMNLITYFVGFSNLIPAVICIMLKCCGMGFWFVIIYMFVADTVEYGAYKTGTKATGVTFSLQTFVAKMKNALMGTVMLYSMSIVGFTEGENAVQAEGVDKGIWGVFCIFPAIGFAIALVLLLLFYKLRTKDVQTMAKYNNGEITKEEAEELLQAKYGPASERV